jgi:hypothetical protein
MYFAHILGVNKRRRNSKVVGGGMTATGKKEYPMRVVSSAPHRQLRHFANKIFDKLRTNTKQNQPPPQFDAGVKKKTTSQRNGETEIQPQPQPATNQVSVHTYRSFQPRTKKTNRVKRI